MLAKSPVVGCVKTRLVPPLTPSESADLARAFAHDFGARMGRLAPLLHATLFLYFTPCDAIKDFGFLEPAPVLRPQCAGDLGAKMRSIVVDLAAEGFGQVVLVGSDIPTLPDAHVAAAFAALDAGDQIAISRAEDGGYVLLGLDALYAELFTDIAWSTASVYDTTVKRARERRRSVHELPPWYDVDTVSDLVRLRQECRTEAGALAPRTHEVLKRLEF